MLVVGKVDLVGTLSFNRKNIKMKKRYFEVIAVMVNQDDRSFDKTGMGATYSSLILATTQEAAEKKLRKEARFRRFCNQQFQDWRDVEVVSSRVTVDEFSSDLKHSVQLSMRRDRFLKRVMAS